MNNKQILNQIRWAFGSSSWTDSPLIPCALGQALHLRIYWWRQSRRVDKVIPHYLAPGPSRPSSLVPSLSSRHPLMLPLPLWLHLSGPFPQCCPLPMFLPSLTCKASISHESELRAISSLIHTGPPPPLPVSHSRRLLRCLLIQHFPHLLLPTCIRGTLRRRRLPSGHCILNTWDTF